MNCSIFYSTLRHCRNLHLVVVRNRIETKFQRFFISNRTSSFISVKQYCQNRQYCQTSKKSIDIDGDISVKELAKGLNIQTTSLIKLLVEMDFHDMRKGTNTMIDFDVAELIADEYGFSVTKKMRKPKENVFNRPPIVTIMGHVDHGKTTLLDNLRNSSVALNEAGGITQSIGAFSVQVPGLTESVTFVDTPGHAAFNSMRSRGAQLTDIVVLVIAAEDGVMAQTKECLDHIRNARVPFIVAINKIDMPNADPEKVKRELMSNGVLLDGYGGDAPCVEISALKNINIDKLLLLLNRFAKAHSFEACLDDPVEAVILEAEKTQKTGITTSVLLKTGKLGMGKVLFSPESKTHVKVKRIIDANGESVQSALPSDPVQIMGWRALPAPGDQVFEMEGEAEVKKAIAKMTQESRPVKQKQRSPTRNPFKVPIPAFQKGGRNKRKPARVYMREEIGERPSNWKEIEAEEKVKELNVFIKADVSGSLEALLGILNSFHSEHLKLNIIEASVGAVTLTDFQRAEAIDGVIYSFNVDPPNDIFEKAEEAGVSIRYFNVIYKLLDDMKYEIENLLPPDINDIIIGEADVLKIFMITGGMKVVSAGCRVMSGFLDKSDEKNLWRVIRDGEQIHEGKIQILKHGKNDIQIAKHKTECALVLKDFVDFQEKDRVVCLRKEVKRKVFDWKL